MPFAAAWSGDDDKGHALPAGVYICRFADGENFNTKKIVKLE
jgi:hypothetical protein